jgi:hypothetical protein
LGRTLVICAAIATLVGCAAPSSPVAPFAAPQRAVSKEAGPADWDLLYVSNSSGTVTVYRSWQHVLYATLTGFESPKGECVDKSGDVFITDSALEEIVKYSHGSKTPIATVDDSGYQPYACSVDPVSGDLAVANYETAGSGIGNVAVFPNATGKPRLYKANLGKFGPLTCGYDDGGNLLIATEYSDSEYEYALFAMLHKGGKTFSRIKLANISQSPFEYVTNVQWDGKYWAVTDNGNIQRFTIGSGGDSTYEGTTELDDNWTGNAQVWLWSTGADKTGEANQLIAAESSDVLYWKYPSGGQSYAALFDGIYGPYGVAVSPKRTAGLGLRPHGT